MIHLFLLPFLCALGPAVAGLANDAVPHYGKWGFDLTAREPKVRPGDDFFGYANGAWLKSVQIPPDRSSYSVAQKSRDIVDDRLRGLLEEAAKRADKEPATLVGKVGAFYRSFMDEKRIDMLGHSPVQGDLEQVQKATTASDIAALMGRHRVDFHGSIFKLRIKPDAVNPSQYSIYIVPSGLGLPSPDYYLKAEFADARSAYQAYIAKILRLVKWQQADQQALHVLRFETQLADATVSYTAMQEAITSYTKLSKDDLSHQWHSFDWKRFLASAFLSEENQLIMLEKGACQKLAEVFANTSLDTLKAWQAFTIVNNSAIYLSEPYVQAQFDLYQKKLSGVPELEARWKRGVRAVSGGDFTTGERPLCFGNMGWAVGELYTARYFPKDVKAKLEEITNNLKAAFQTRIENLDWMGPNTKREALKKLDRCTIEVGYPEKNRNYSDVKVVDDDLVGNVRRAALSDWMFRVKRLHEPVDKGEWEITPQTINAYNSYFGQLVFPAALLLPPMYNPEADLAINYGSVGAFIGHEMIHGFDHLGRKFDADGKLVDWWDDADAKEFEMRAQELVKQYSDFEVFPDIYVNGELTLSENIADLGGLTLALDAYLLALKGEAPEILDGYTGKQRLFLGWAQLWRGKLREDALKRYIVSDPHSPRKFRVNGVVRNIDGWYESFEVAPEDSLYLDPKARVRLW